MQHAQPVDRGFSWSAGVLAFALLLVIALTALLGWALLQRLGGTRPVAATGHSHTSHAQTEIGIRPRSATSVLVLNGNGVSGAAGGAANRLLADGYRHASATNAAVTTYSQSFVLYRPGWQNEARRLAKDAHIGAVAPLDGPLPAAAPRSPLVVILGH